MEEYLDFEEQKQLCELLDKYKAYAISEYNKETRATTKELINRHIKYAEEIQDVIHLEW